MLDGQKTCWLPLGLLVLLRGAFLFQGLAWLLLAFLLSIKTLAHENSPDYWLLRTMLLDTRTCGFLGEADTAW
jgi:hypothetical protein